MRFDYNEYYKILFIGSLCILIFAFVAILINSFLFFKKGIFRKFNKKFVFYILSIVVCLFLSLMALFPMQHGVHLVKEKEVDKMECEGIVTDFKKTYGNNKYVYNGKNTFAYYIFIDDEKYYIIHTGDLEIGDKVVFEYLPKSRVILSIEEKQQNT